jgi:phosphoglycolate phosphatase-like HAD superfamily hydrolase
MKTIVFDLDGTLISCRPRQVTALRAVSGLSSLYLSKIWRAKRDGLTTRDALIQVSISVKQADELTRAWARVIETHYFLSYDHVLPGAADALRLCRTFGFHIVILTARRSKRSAMLQLKTMRLDGMVDEILIVDPRNAAAQKAAELRQLSPSALIGDSEVDAAAAASAGVPFFPVSSGQRSRDFLLREFGLLSFDGVLPATQAALGSFEGQLLDPP